MSIKQIIAITTCIQWRHLRRFWRQTFSPVLLSTERALYSAVIRLCIASRGKSVTFLDHSVVRWRRRSEFAANKPPRRQMVYDVIWLQPMGYGTGVTWRRAEYENCRRRRRWHVACASHTQNRHRTSCRFKVSRFTQARTWASLPRYQAVDVPRHQFNLHSFFNT